MKKIIAIVYLVLVGATFHAQDFHLSQFDAAEIRMNPAMAGRDYKEGNDYRISNIYRTQWSAVSSKPFTTIYLAYDTRYKKKWGFGGHLMNNQAGNMSFRTFSLDLCASYNIINDPKNEHTLVVGLQMGMMNKSFKSQMVFDSQYSSSTGGFDPSADNGESFLRRSIVRFDAGVGLYYRYRPTGKKYSPYGGISLGHISFPDQSFYGGWEAVPMIMRISAGSDFKIKESFEINPVFLMMYQRKAQEYFLNVNGRYKLKNENYDIRFLMGYRLKDAFVFGAGMRYKEIVAKVSYDINTSYLSNYTHGRGGFEISLAYQGFYRSEKFKTFIGKF